MKVVILPGRIHITDVNKQHVTVVIFTSCKQAVTQRLQEESRDYRLNPTMRRVCFVDIGKFCSEKRKEGKINREMDLQGEMMKCLQGKLEDGKKVCVWDK